MNEVSVTSALKVARDAHVDLVGRGQREYQMIKELTKPEQNAYFSVVIDGAEQKNFSSPRFVTSRKEQR